MSNYKQSIRHWRDQLQENGRDIKQLDYVLSTIDAPVWSYSLDKKFLGQIQQAVDATTKHVKAEFDQLLAEVEEG